MTGLGWKRKLSASAEQASRDTAFQRAAEHVASIVVWRMALRGTGALAHALNILSPLLLCVWRHLQHK